MPASLPPLGRYHLETHLGSGAFADVYRATDTLLDRVVALKVLKPSLVADQQAFKRFLQEAKTAANLLHDHIAWVWDLGEADGRYFIAMRYVDGPSLAKVLADRGPLPWDEAYARFRELAESLTFAHQKGLVHRDLKPQNILISPTEGAVLTDFGLVKAMQTSGLSTHTGALIGTPQYIAPEVWQGKEATPATDQYALACVLVEMLTGITLFDAPTPPAVMMKHFMPLALPEKWASVVPNGYETIIRKALLQEVKERHASIRAFFEAVENVLEEEQARVAEQARQAQEAAVQMKREQDEKAHPFDIYTLLDLIAAKGKQDAPERMASLELARNEISEDSWQENLPKDEENLDEKPSKKLVSNLPNYKVQEKKVLLAPEIELVLVNIPAGNFLNGIISDEANEDVSEGENTISYKEIYLDEFWISKYPITVEQFACFVEATRYRNNNRKSWMSGLFNLGWKFDVGQNGDHPITGVSWNDAVAFLIWANNVTGLEFRLPSEEEWEKAASGVDGRKFPWGNEPPDDTLCNFNENIGNKTPVGEYSPEADSFFGCSDMAGNVFEWTTSIYEEKTSNDIDDVQEEEIVEDEVGLDSECRIIKGGSFLSPLEEICCANWEFASKDSTSEEFGFRVCVSSKSIKR
jgi:serine/threonine-protein kinase